MPGFFDNKVVWITGASSGIGEALAKVFAQQGAKLILSARNENELNRVKENCSSPPENIYILPLDLTLSSDIRSKSIMAIARWEGIDYLINNAGIASRGQVVNTDMTVYRKVMETNFFGSIALTKEVLPSMINTKKGHIVVVSSMAGKLGSPLLSTYSSSKHALHGFFDTLRMEVKKEGIHITLIVPGFINTPILVNSMDEKGKVTGKNLKINENGMSSEKCAQKIIQAIKKTKREALISGWGKATVYTHRFFPGLFYKIIGNHPIKKMRRFFPMFFKK